MKEWLINTSKDSQTHMRIKKYMQHKSRMLERVIKTIKEIKIILIEQSPFEFVSIYIVQQYINRISVIS